MLKFTYKVTVNALPFDDDKKFVECLTGTLEAEGHAQATKQAQSLAFDRCRQLERERGDIFGSENVQIVLKPEQDSCTDTLADLTFLNTLKHQIRDVTRALDTTQHVFGQSLEERSVKHEVTILLSELGVHGLLPASNEMTPRDYMHSALRTLYPDLTISGRLGLCGLGLPGEIGEVVDLIKKFLYHRNGKSLDVDKFKDELGDVLWYYAVLLDTLGLTFEEVMQANITKMQQRHPHGFNPLYASDSHASEVSL